MSSENTAVEKVYTYEMISKNGKTVTKKVVRKYTNKKDTSNTLQNKANKEFLEKSKTLGVDDSLKTISGLDQEMILCLAENNVKNLDDLADLASDELMEILGEGVVTEVEANRIIMAAREHWFKDEQ